LGKLLTQASFFSGKLAHLVRKFFPPYSVLTAKFIWLKLKTIVKTLAALNRRVNYGVRQIAYLQKA